MSFRNISNEFHDSFIRNKMIKWKTAASSCIRTRHFTFDTLIVDRILRPTHKPFKFCRIVCQCAAADKEKMEYAPGGGADAQIGKPGSVPSVSTFRSAWHPRACSPTVVCLGYIVAPSLISQIVGDLLQSMLQSVWASPAPGPLTQWEKHACIRFGIWVAVDYIRWVSTICVCVCCCIFFFL